MKQFERDLYNEFSGQFMQPEITCKQVWFSVNDGEHFYPGDYFTKEEVEELHPVVEVEEEVGYGARLSASGYLDCTEWAVFDSQEEAAEYLMEMYGDNE